MIDLLIQARCSAIVLEIGKNPLKVGSLRLWGRAAQYLSPERTFEPATTIMNDEKPIATARLRMEFPGPIVAESEKLDQYGIQSLSSVVVLSCFSEGLR